MKLKSLILPVAMLVAAATPAMAHPGLAHVHGIVQGFTHPVSGVDHILAMVAVGVIAAKMGGRALWLVPGAFLAMMVAGGVIGFVGVAVPFVEPAIAASVVVLGLMVALSWRPPVAVAMGLAGAFAVFHGLAHAYELPVVNTSLAYAAGFVAATAMLHAVGLAVGLSYVRVSRRLAKAA
jgi:urease accessory protein